MEFTKSLALLFFSDEIERISDPVLHQRMKAVASAIDRHATITNCEIFLSIARQAVLVSFGKEGVEIVFDTDSVKFYKVKCGGGMVAKRDIYHQTVITSNTNVEDVVFSGIAVYLLK